MDDYSEIVTKKLCCTCLSRDRKLSQLCRLKEGINHLYLLLSPVTKAYRENFFKVAASWYICWECWAIMRRISKFRAQACVAHHQLLDIIGGRTDFKLLKACLSHLTVTQTPSFDLNIIEQDMDNFIDCGVNIKTESQEDIPMSLLHNISDPDDLINSDEEDYKVNTKTENEEDTPLSLSHNSSDPDDESNSDEEAYEELIQPQIVKVESEPLSEKKVKKPTVIINKKKVLYIKASNENKLSGVEDKPYVCTKYMNNFELNKRGIELKVNAVFADAQFKCESCIEVFKSKLHLDYHISQFHTNSGTEKLISEQHRLRTILDERTPYGYWCPQCDQYFETKDKRSIHIQKVHTKGYICDICDKRCCSTYDLKLHILTHQKPEPREECPVCHKMFRVDFIKSHAEIHAERHRYECAECNKTFEKKRGYQRHMKHSRAHATADILKHKKPAPRGKCPVCDKIVRLDTMKQHALTHSTKRDRYECAECNKTFVSKEVYKCHIKYSGAHATIDIHKYKCSMCGKGYRSPGELRTHMNSNHTRETEHKCSICGKVLANPKSLKRHMMYVHEGVKQKKNKKCQQCGKTFTVLKTLREHLLIHTGERPLSCDICGDTFRQRASLYTHKRRVHKLKPTKKVTLLETAPSSEESKRSAPRRPQAVNA